MGWFFLNGTGSGKFLLLAIFCSLFLDFCTPKQEKGEKELDKKVVQKDTLPSVEVYDSKTAIKLDSLFDSWVKGTKFNGNVLIAQGSNIIYKKCFGLANHETNTPLNYHSSFQLASVSKQFTAAAIMLLEERGLLTYHDTLQKYFPEFPYKNITIDMLLSHRSGLANYMYFCDSYCKNYDSAIDNRQVIEWMNSCKPAPYYRPGRRFQYNNTNYCLLVAIVEQVSKMPFDVFLKKEIFEPLEMKDTWVKTSLGDTIRPNITQGYESGWNRAEINYLDGVVGDKNVYSSIEDLYKWDQALYTERILKKATLENAFEKKNRMNGPKNYGYGWRLFFQPDGTRLVYHNGWWHGYNSSFYRRTNDKTTIIILCNRRDKQIFQTQTIFEILDNNCQNLDLESDA